MSSISVLELRHILEAFNDEDEVIMEIRHKYPISKEDGEKGWIAYINAIKEYPDIHEVRLMN